MEEAPNTLKMCPKCGSSLTPDNWFTASTGDKYHFFYCDQCDEHFEDVNLNLRIVTQNLFKRSKQ